jgi:DNA-binding transcriptional MerR regulator
MEIKYDLTTEQVARIAGCHRNTVLRYERNGYLNPMRDNNNFRRYSLQDAIKIKKLLSIRKSV